ncbi:transcription antitermination factor NusB [Blochmannia endosymbiont of Camponotus (Colobopsis) obliquus]|uniref:transcription antitermination factor NusB n=1 Tax=Blochmannia endosymbiont of Camponotus (Colobopsis) obliquus TaxID=1505597 RepID=UPI00061A854C|nr:transcription antitermination factor NusB [Blochmannia endosymbiont of Camponotus (Colobopsis) obliquus]AKC60399.1 N utilization substance protein B [Blochmannia endosymbiont of Camponotus (Colobopsis) obliquus]
MEIKTRRRARECALQALYSWQISHNDIKDVIVDFISEQNMCNVNVSYFYQLYIGVTTCVYELDQLMLPYLSRQFERLDHIEKAVLRIALFELSNCFDVPYKVVINEAIELAKIFGAEKSHKFINGVLDKVALKIRISKN